jgi:hypothetical protein
MATHWRAVISSGKTRTVGWGESANPNDSRHRYVGLPDVSPQPTALVLIMPIKNEISGVLMIILVRCLLYIALISACAWFAISGSSPFRDIAIGIIGGLIVAGVDFVSSNASHVRYLLESIRFFDVDVRLSVSYLYRIKIDDKYLLVRGHRIRNQYQPVGGVYKKLPDSDGFFNSINALDDNLFKIDPSSKGDLRLRIKGRHVFEFMRWFDSAKGRETDVWREFYEELVVPKIVNLEDFGYVFTRHIKRHVTPIYYSPYVQMRERIVAEVYELIPSTLQEKALRALLGIENQAYKWVTEDVIKRRGVVPKESFEGNVAETAEWIL